MKERKMSWVRTCALGHKIISDGTEEWCSRGISCYHEIGGVRQKQCVVCCASMPVKDTHEKCETCRQVLR